MKKWWRHTETFPTVNQSVNQFMDLGIIGKDSGLCGEIS